MVMALTRGPAQGDDEQATGVQDAGAGVLAVEAEGGLSVGAGLDQPVAVSLGEQLPEAAGCYRPAAVLERVGRHGEAHVVGQQCQQAVEVGGGVGAGELVD